MNESDQIKRTWLHAWQRSWQHTAPSYQATVAALAIGQTLSWAVLYYGFSSFVLPMMRETGWSNPTAMGAFTLGLFCSAAATYGAGAAIDKGHGRALMTWGAVLAGAGVLLWSTVGAPWALYLAWVMMGLSMAATLYEPAFAVLTHRYATRYRQAITALTLVAGFASTLSFPACAALIQSLGWRPALWVLAGVMILVVAPLNAWALRGTAQPEPSAQQPLPTAMAPAAEPTADITLHDALHQRSFWLLSMCFMLFSFGAAALWAHVVPALESKGWSETQALAVLVWIGPAQVLGRVIYVAAAQHVSLRLAGFAVVLFMPLALALFAASNSTWALLLFAVLFGMSNGLVTIVRGGLVPEYFGRANVGRISGAMSTIGLMARAFAPLLAAWMLLWLPGYGAVMALLAALGVLSALAYWWAGPPRL